MATIYISVGSNIEPDVHVRSARAALEASFGPAEASPVYRTEAVGFDGDDFLNLVLALHTDEAVETVDAELDRIERDNGRDHAAPRFAPRTLDLDLLLYDELVMDEDGLRLPRKEIMKYAFVLKPLADLAPDMRHPVDGRCYAELLRELDLGSQRCEAIAFDW
ncbi:MAG: 2-amino-4-hydroxy-6-hydroxymethyldihydropteridine diphosphokinase [Gammaproteobacteria bacterium]|nr:2-amino-4-hydroxy-6-hydroxymethyldihydropteridine diphosphokinase [Gammaproteobacteria bacterium]